jgi:Ca2+-binding RTX toxin-like protein
MATHAGSLVSDTIWVRERPVTCIAGTWIRPRGYLIGATAGAISPSGGFDDLWLTIFAGAGNDRVDLTQLAIGSGLTAIVVYGDTGDDVLLGSELADSLYGGVGNDTLRGGSGADTLVGDDGKDSLSGGDGVDNIRGGAGNDHIYGDQGDDILSGDAGEDSLHGGIGADVLDGGDGSDALSGDAGDDTLYGGPGHDSLSGQDGKDLAIGHEGNDNLFGGLGNDTLRGETGDDRLGGQSGWDQLTGGAGRDAFYFYNQNEGLDRIIDFDASWVTGDYFEVSSSGFKTIGAPGTLASQYFRLGPSATTLNHRFIYNPLTGLLGFDPDGIGSAARVDIAQLTPGLSLSNSHFQVVAW